MELPVDISSAVEKLCQNPDFLANITTFTNTAFCALLNLVEEEQQACPSTFLFAINHLLTNNLKFELLLPYMPAEAHRDYLKVCSYYQKIIDGQKILDEVAPTVLRSMRGLVNVSTSIHIENAREYWNIKLEDSQGSCTSFRVEFEAMAMVVFKLGQLVRHIESVNFAELCPKQN